MFIVNGSRFTAREMLARAMAEEATTGDCEAPVEIAYRGLPDPVRVKLGLEKDQTAVARIYGRCRKCSPCLRHRQRLWSARGFAESAVSSRTWFGTLTFNPVERVKHLYRAQIRHQRQTGEQWANIGEAEQFRYIAAETGSEVTRYLKRTRKGHAELDEAPVRFRYLLVSEAHEDGFPHHHLLLHELGEEVVKRRLDRHWHQGFAKWRLAEVGSPKGAWYVCKYLSKSALTRVRASQRYGQLDYVGKLFAERLEGVNVAMKKSANAAGQRRGLSRDEVAAA